MPKRHKGSHAKSSRRQFRDQLHIDMTVESDGLIEQRIYQDSVKEQKRRGQPLSILSEAQGHYRSIIESSQLTFGTGPAGTGKTFVAAKLAAMALDERKIEKIIISRPAIEVGKGLGFLPGTIEEKFAPYFAPFKVILEEHYGRGHFEYLTSHGKIEIAPLEYLRGSTFSNAFVILDEAQNTTPAQMLMFLTRIGEGSQVVVNGDVDQCDLPGQSGLADALSRLASCPGVGTFQFEVDDIVRSGLVKDILIRYRSSKST